jgi:hypothetical protein
MLHKQSYCRSELFEQSITSLVQYVEAFGVFKDGRFLGTIA